MGYLRGVWDTSVLLGIVVGYAWKVAKRLIKFDEMIDIAFDPEKRRLGKDDLERLMKKSLLKLKKSYRL